jgi:hypothetical protein
MNKEIISEIKRFREIMNYGDRLLVEAIGTAIKDILEKVLQGERNVTVKDNMERLIGKLETGGLKSAEKTELKNWVKSSAKTLESSIEYEIKNMSEVEVKEFFSTLNRDLDGVFGTGFGKSVTNPMETKYRQAISDARFKAQEIETASLKSVEQSIKNLDQYLKDLNIGTWKDVVKLKGHDLAVFNDKFKPELRSFIERELPKLTPELKQKFALMAKQYEKKVPNLWQKVYGHFRGLNVYVRSIATLAIVAYISSKMGHFLVPVFEFTADFLKSAKDEVVNVFDKTTNPEVKYSDDIPGFIKFLKEKGDFPDAKQEKATKVDDVYTYDEIFPYIYKDGTFIDK